MQVLYFHCNFILNKIANISYLSVCALTAIDGHCCASEVGFLAGSNNTFILLVWWFVTDTNDMTGLPFVSHYKT